MSTILIDHSEVGGNGRTSVLLKFVNAGMQGQEFLRPPGVVKAALAPLLLSGGPMRLFDQVITVGGQDDLDVIHAVKHRKSSDRCSVAPQLVSMDHVWNVTLHRKPFQKGDRRLRTGDLAELAGAGPVPR